MWREEREGGKEKRREEKGREGGRMEGEREGRREGGKEGERREGGREGGQGLTNAAHEPLPPGWQSLFSSQIADLRCTSVSAGR